MKTSSKSISGYIRFLTISKILQKDSAYIRGYVPIPHCIPFVEVSPWSQSNWWDPSLAYTVGLCKPIFGFVCVLIDLYLRAQEELGARDTRIRQPLTWSSRKIKKFGNIFFRKNILSSSMLIAFRENPKIWRIFWSLSYRDCYQKCSNWWFSGIGDDFFLLEISETKHPGSEQTLLAWQQLKNG